MPRQTKPVMEQIFHIHLWCKTVTKTKCLSILHEDDCPCSTLLCLFWPPKVEINQFLKINQNKMWEKSVSGAISCCQSHFLSNAHTAAHVDETFMQQRWWRRLLFFCSTYPGGQILLPNPQRHTHAHAHTWRHMKWPGTF